MGYKVKQRYRTNSLSFASGGVTVEVERRDGRRFEYNNIKHPEAYIAKLQRDPEIRRVWVKEERQANKPSLNF